MNNDSEKALYLGLGGTGRELGAHHARVSASIDSLLLKMRSELASASSAGRWFHSRMVLFMSECLISSVLLDHLRDLRWCDALVLESAHCSPSKSGVTATSPCIILHMGQGAGISYAALKSATWGPWLVERHWPAFGGSSHTPSVGPI